MHTVSRDFRPVPVSDFVLEEPRTISEFDSFAGGPSAFGLRMTPQNTQAE